MKEDTSPAIRKAYWARLRAMTPSERLTLGIELSELADQMVRAGVRLRHPDAGLEDFQYHVLRAKYGRRLAEKVHGGRTRAAGS